MAHADFWSQGRVLIAGDSRVRRLMNNPDVTLSGNVDFAFEGGILVDDLIALVDKTLTEHHKVIVLIGFIGDEIQKFVHHISEDTSVTLLCSKESEGIDKILASVQAANAKWLELKNERVILWALPYYVDYVGYNSARIGEFDMGNALTISLESSKLFVNYVARLQRQMQTTMPNINYCLLNRALFEGRANTSLYQSFGAVCAKDYRFPSNMLSDGLHPSSELAERIWAFLHKSVCNVHDRLTGKKDVPTFSPKVKEVHLPKFKKNFKSKGFSNRKQQPVKKPYSHKKINLHFQKAPIHSRIYHPQEEETVEELIEEDPASSYPNLSWKSPHYQAQQTQPKDTSYIDNQPGHSRWSWTHHRQVLSEARMSVYTQGLKEQILAKGRLATIIRERGLWGAGQGQVDTVNVASNKWTVKQHAELNAPHENAKLVQDDLANLLPVDSSSESSENEI